VSLVLCGGVCAQNLNPTQDLVRLQVTRFDLPNVNQDMIPGVTTADLQRRLVLERGRFAEQMSVDEMHQVADALTAYLRNQGLVFHSVYVPPQRVDGGVVELRLQPGVLAKVHVINKTRWEDKRYVTPFKNLLNKVLLGPEVEDRVQALKAIGGFKVFAFYSRGGKAGEAVLNLRVDPTNKRAWAVKVDNFGSESTGKNRLIAQYSEFELTGHHDRLMLAILNSPEEEANLYGSLAYQLPMKNLDYAWDISASNHQFGVGGAFDALELEGKASNLRTGFSMITRHHPDNHSGWRLGLTQKTNRLDNPEAKLADEVSQSASVQWSRSKKYPRSAWIAQAVLEYSLGKYEVEGWQDDQFNKLDYSLGFTHGDGTGRLRNTLLLGFRGQYADNRLPSVEGFALSGAYGVRAFAPGLFNAERSLLSTLEWRFPTLVNATTAWRMEPYVFAEHGLGSKESTSAGRLDASFAGLGLGVSAYWGQHVYLNLLATQSLSGRIDGVEVESDAQVLFEIRFQ
jgi:hemolysin activation/secretion protein